jgi:hypothetical protein
VEWFDFRDLYLGSMLVIILAFHVGQARNPNALLVPYAGKHSLSSSLF